MSSLMKKALKSHFKPVKVKGKLCIRDREMVKNTPKINHRTTTKTLSVTTENFIAHPLVSKAFQIYCENFPATSFHQNLHRPLIFDVIKDNDRFYFFDNFAEAVRVNETFNITVRQVDLSNIDIERRGWGSLKADFYGLKPISPKVFNELKKHMPRKIAEALFKGTMTIEKVLNDLQLERHHYDYQAKLKREHSQHTLPSFSQLIQEVRDGH